MILCTEIIVTFIHFSHDIRQFSLKLSFRLITEKKIVKITDTLN